jgi:nitroimidazol reductase NimA-like FMN-containing flavoprotein (pyridoxamine 5'-phosphate oxidase superfamily)
MDMTTSLSRIEELSASECLALLGAHHVGRLAVVVNGQPLVFPVNYGVSGRRVIFRTGPGTKLHAAEGRPVAFEIDSSDALYHDGWSVLVTGRATEETDPHRLREYEQLGVRPWVPGNKSHWMTISGGAMTGRRIAHVEREELS